MSSATCRAHHVERNYIQGVAFDRIWSIGGGHMAHYSRRDFLKAGLAAGVLAGTGSLPLRASRGTATDWVTLGYSARYVPADVQGDDARRGESAGEDRRTAQAGEYRILRHHADALPARGYVADRYRAVAG